MSKVYARLIYKGKMRLSDVPKKYQDATREAFLELYGYELGD